MSRADVLCLDFDGVVLESVRIKDEAYWRLFDDHPESVRDRVLARHKETPGVERSRKVRDFLTLVSGREPTPDEVARRLARFVDLCRDGLRTCPEVPGVIGFLQGLAGRAVYVVSAAPGAEVRETSEARGFASLFKDILGSPAPKPELLELILEREDVTPDKIVFVGDMISDFKAALAVGVRFIGRVAEGRASPFPPSVPVIADFTAGAAVVLDTLDRPA